MPLDAQGVTSCTAPATTVNIVTAANQFDHPCYAAPVGPFTITFNNQDPFAHNLSIYDKKGGNALFQGAYVAKASTMTYNVPTIPAGAYYFQCDIHPFMNGKFAIGVYIGTSNFAASYGVAGAFVVILLWVNYTAQILLFGAEITRAQAEMFYR